MPPETQAKADYVVFADLHVSERTLARCVEVLQRVGDIAEAQGATIVFCGDFWDARDVIRVRHLDAIHECLADWLRRGLLAFMLPGNHDHVSVDGTVHAMKMFDGYPHITVTTEPLLDEKNRVAFLPWREDPVEQSKLFTDLPGTGWTVFAHAEIQGAATNYGHLAPGRVTIESIEKKTAALYAGHYHRRQKIGDRAWYVGNPYEKDFGELGDPKGIALVTRGVVDPVFVDFNDLPKHRKLTMGDDTAAVRPGDIVQVTAPRESLGTEAARAYLESLPSGSASVVQAATAEIGPVTALTLDAALTAYVEAHGLDSGVAAADLEKLGRDFLRQAPDAAALAPLFRKVEPVMIETTNFCALRGDVAFDLDKKGVVLLRGPIGSGKTALTDAITWCLYGVTAPRKAGANGASLRGDEVVNDDAKEASVAFTLRCDGSPVTIRRTKARGVGAKVTITGLAVPVGIADHDELIPRIVGIPHALWRTSVNLGQGAVGNFVTDADKQRKTLLTDAFGLGACDTALALAKKKVQPLKVSVAGLENTLLGETRALETRRSMDFAAQSRQWAEQQATIKESLRKEGEAAKAVIAECEAKLADAGQWQEAKADAEARLDKAVKRLSSVLPASKQSELQQQLGSCRAERQIVERDLAQRQAEYANEEAKFMAGSLPCPTCQRPFEMDDAERHLAHLRESIGRYGQSISTLDARMLNVQHELTNLSKAGDASREEAEKQVAEAREVVAKCNSATALLDRIRHNELSAKRELEAARKRWQDQDKLQNPFEAKAAENAQLIAASDAKIAATQAELATTRLAIEACDFWVEGFGPKGLPVVVLRSAIGELEQYANRFLAELLSGRIYCRLGLTGENLEIKFYETAGGQIRERRYEQLSGGQRRCVELAFSPFAVSEMVFARCGVNIPLLIIDELTTHLGQDEKPKVCDLLKRLDRATVLVVDHDISVQGEFETVFDIRNDATGVHITRAS